MIQEEQGITREKILACAEKYQVCPFELCLDISSWVDGIICDYNYVFDPNVRLKRYFAEGEEKGDYIFLVDWFQEPDRCTVRLLLKKNFWQ